MAILKKFEKQPAEVQDYDVDFAPWLTGLGDTASSFAVVAEEGLTVDTSALVGTRVKVWASGGTSGTSYKVTVTLTTAGGRVKEDEIVIKVKET